MLLSNALLHTYCTQLVVIIITPNINKLNTTFVIVVVVVVVVVVIIIVVVVGFNLKHRLGSSNKSV
jgi:signal transduction histidine kinase